MPDRPTADVLDALVAGTLAADVSLAGRDFRGEMLRDAAAGRAEVPVWWDAAAGRLSLRGADYRGRGLRGANFTAASLEQANFADADLAEAVLADALLGGAVFDRGLLEETKLAAAHLRFASFREAVLESADLRGADLWGAKLEEADADKADFRDAELEEADFRRADARAADFRGARLGLTDFRDADLRASDFRGCVVRAAKFDAADLRGANLEHLDLSNAALAGVWLSDARLDRTRFHRSQLGAAIGEELGGEFELARRAYLSLERNFLDIGDPEAAGWAYRRRRRMQKADARRHAVLAVTAADWRAAPGWTLAYANLKLVELVCDYGESVPRVLATLFVVFATFAAGFAASGTVIRTSDDGRKEITRSATDVIRYSLTAMIAPGNPPDDLRPADELTQIVTLTESFTGIFLTGLLGFVAGNRIRR